jgi:hypothetical protein
MVTWSIAVGHRPRDLPFVEIDSGDPAVRRLQQRKPERCRRIFARARVNVRFRLPWITRMMSATNGPVIDCT